MGIQNPILYFPQMTVRTTQVQFPCLWIDLNNFVFFDLEIRWGLLYKLSSNLNVKGGDLFTLYNIFYLCVGIRLAVTYYNAARCCIQWGAVVQDTLDHSPPHPDTPDCSQD